jgi:ABC-2 type transport system permease protein
MKKVVVVARWEYLEKVRSKAFLIGLLVTPLLMTVMGILPTYFAAREDSETKVIGLIDKSGDLAVEFAKRMHEQYKLPNGRPNYIVDILGSGEGTPFEEVKTKADAMIADKEIEGYCIIGQNILSDSVIEYRSGNIADFRLLDRIEENVRYLVRWKKAVAMGLDPALLKELTVSMAVKPVKLSSSGEEDRSGFLQVFFSAYIFLLMLFFLIVTSGQMLVRSVIEEKSNRIVEVLVSSSSSTELMAGKVVGLSLLGLTQMAFWALIGLALSIQFNVMLVSISNALLLIVYFVLGYVFYAGIFIAAGSPLTTEQEAQQVTSYLVLLLVFPLVVALPAMQHPDATWLKVLTYVPFLTPTMMALRIPIQTPPIAEVLTTVLLMIVSTFAVMWAAGRIFRIAVLATGKRPRVVEILTWLKTG